MADNLEVSPHKPTRKRITRNPKPKRRAFDDAEDNTDIIGPGADPKAEQ
jgi:hypothetical protein